MRKPGKNCCSLTKCSEKIVDKSCDLMYNKDNYKRIWYVVFGENAPACLPERMNAMKKSWKRLCGAAIAAAICTGMVQSVPVTPASAEGKVIFQSECEDLSTYDTNSQKVGDKPTLWKDIYGREIPGYSGDGFVYLTNETLIMTVDAPANGMYDITVNMAQILGEDGREQTICVNGTDFMVKFPYADKFQEFQMGKFRLNEGENTILLKPQYGYGCYDTITVREAEKVDLTVEPKLSDAKATKETQSLMNYLTSVYGKHMLSGQQEIYGGGNDGNYELEFDYIYDLSGEYPAIRGFDFMNYNPLYGWDDNSTERCIDWVNKRHGIATACWHINLPNDFANYTVGEAVDWEQCSYGRNTTFSVAEALKDDTKENQYLNMAIEDLAEQFARLQEANVPVIFRPFHEAEGNGGLDGKGAWFWWSQEGAEVYKALWQYLYTKMTVDYDLHNIIWEQNLYAWSDESAQWYAGDDYVDIVGFDKYNTEYNRHDGKPSNSGPNEDAESSTFYNLVKYVNGKKMVSMPENDSIPSVENILVEDAMWLYFCPWYGDHILSDMKNAPESVKEMYQSDLCITLSELPENLYDNAGDFPIVTDTPPTTTIATTTEPSELPEVIKGDYDGNQVVNGMDLALARQDILLDTGRPWSDSEMLVRDFNQDGKYLLDDIVAMTKFLLGT